MLGRRALSALWSVILREPQKGRPPLLRDLPQWACSVRGGLGRPGVHLGSSLPGGLSWFPSQFPVPFLIEASFSQSHCPLRAEPRVHVLANGCMLLSLGGAPGKALSLGDWLWFALELRPDDRGVDAVPGGAALMLLLLPPIIINNKDSATVFVRHLSEPLLFTCYRWVIKCSAWDR